MQALTLQSKLTSFNSNKNTILITDTSKLNGAAASLFQQEDDEKLTLIWRHSICLRPIERNWSATELEYLALTYGLKKFKYYLHGLPKFEHWTDHSTLTSLVKMDLDKLPNQRILNLRLLCQDYNIITKYAAGGKGVHYLMDHLSRNPMPLEHENDIINLCVQNSQLSMSPDNPDPALEKLKKHTKECDQYQRIIQFFRSDMKYKYLPENHSAR